jgi:hypothetical protein
MDEGSGLNIKCAKTLDAMRIIRSQLRPSGAPFHGICNIPEIQTFENHNYKIFLK